MREPPWLEPLRWPASNCSSRTTSRPRLASHHAAADPMAPAPTTTTSGTAGHYALPCGGCAPGPHHRAAPWRSLARTCACARRRRLRGALVAVVVVALGFVGAPTTAEAAP